MTMTMTTDPKTKAVQLGPFVIAPTFTSKSGTGRRCDTIQGWELRLADGSPLSNGDRRDWNSSRREAIEQAEKWFAEAHTANVEDLTRYNIRYLEWLHRVWPEATVASRALELSRQRRDQAIATEQERQDQAKRALARAQECVEFCAKHTDLKTCVIVDRQALEGMVKVLLQVVHDGPRVTEPMVRIHLETARLALEALGIERVREIQTVLNATGNVRGWPVAVV